MQEDLQPDELSNIKLSSTLVRFKPSNSPSLIFLRYFHDNLIILPRAYYQDKMTILKDCHASSLSRETSTGIAIEEPLPKSSYCMALLNNWEILVKVNPIEKNVAINNEITANDEQISGPAPFSLPNATFMFHLNMETPWPFALQNVPMTYISRESIQFSVELDAYVLTAGNLTIELDSLSFLQEDIYLMQTEYPYAHCYYKNADSMLESPRDQPADSIGDAVADPYDDESKIENDFLILRVKSKISSNFRICIFKFSTDRPLTVLSFEDFLLK